jgi:hypothetical protein
MIASNHGGGGALDRRAGGSQNRVISFASQAIAQDPIEVVKQVAGMAKCHASGRSRLAHCEGIVPAFANGNRNDLK